MKTLQKIGFTNELAANLGFALFFSAFLKQSWKLFLENPVLAHSLRIGLFPFILLTETVRAILSWRQAKQEKYQSRPLIRALHDTFAAAASITAVTLGFTLGAVYTTLAPPIFTALLGFNSLVHLTSSIYYAFKGNTAARNDHFAAALVLGLFSASLGALTFAGNTMFALLGVVGAAISVGYSVYKASKGQPVQKTQPNTQNEAARPLTQNKPKGDIHFIPQSVRSRTLNTNAQFSKFSGSLVNNLPRTSASQESQKIEKNIPTVSLQRGF